MFYQASEITAIADRLLKQHMTRDPKRLARELDIEIIPLDFKKQKGAYTVICRNRFIFIKNDLDPITEKIVLLHELGHDALHRDEAIKHGGLREFNIFDMRDNRMEYEANVFAAQLSLPDDEFLELAKRGYSNEQIARALNSDINLVALKCDTLIQRGFALNPQEHRNDFLKYDK